MREGLGRTSPCLETGQGVCLLGKKVFVHSWNMIEIASSVTLEEGCGRVGVHCPHLLLTTQSH